MHNNQWHSHQTTDVCGPMVNLDFVRILVLDGDKELISDFENALWVWPHKVSLAADIDDAVRLCEHLTPSAILSVVDLDSTQALASIPKLRQRLPNVPIVAVVSRQQSLTPGAILDQGADALLLRENAHRPTLHGLISGIQRKSASLNSVKKSHAAELEFHWRQSAMIGALICDVNGSIVDCNETLANWLGYSSTMTLQDRNVPRDLLPNLEDWLPWTEIAGDTCNALHQETEVLTKNGQRLWTKIEVFAAASHPSHLQAAIVDQTELAMLTGRRPQSVPDGPVVAIREGRSI